MLMQPINIKRRAVYLCIESSHFMYTEKANHVLVTSEQFCQLFVLIWFIIKYLINEKQEVTILSLQKPEMYLELLGLTAKYQPNAATALKMMRKGGKLGMKLQQLHLKLLLCFLRI